MLTGTELGAAIGKAIELKGVPQNVVAAEFGVKPPSVQGWIKTGAISKAKLPKLWDYFADVVDWSHWGMDGAPGAAASPPALDALLDGLGTVLRRLPVSSRPAAAGILHSWAIEPERDDWRAMLHMLAASKQHSRAA